MLPIRLHQALKQRLRRHSRMSDELLHVHAGMAVFLSAALLLGVELSSPWPLLSTLLVECTNELFDRLRKGSWHWRETCVDFGHTMVWPFLLWLIASTGWIG